MLNATNIYQDFPKYSFNRAPEADGDATRHPVLIVGGRPVGLTLAADLRRYGIPTLVLQSSNSVSFGSRAICISRRSLESRERFGVSSAGWRFTGSDAKMNQAETARHQFDTCGKEEQT